MSEQTINGFDFSTLPIIITYVGKVEDKEWPHYLWSVAIQRKGGVYVTQYKTGLGLVVQRKGTMKCGFPKGTVGYKRWEEASMVPKKPTNADVMYSLLSDARALDTSFEYWCDDYGYDNDSIKALNTYQACCEIGKEIKKCFTREQVSEMEKALEDY